VYPAPAGEPVLPIHPLENLRTHLVRESVQGVESHRERLGHDVETELAMSQRLLNFGTE
jgi:hypothetical protein